MAAAKRSTPVLWWEDLFEESGALFDRLEETVGYTSDDLVSAIAARRHTSPRG